MRRNRLGCALINASAIILAALIVAASINMQYVTNISPVFGRFWTSYFESIGWPVTFLCLALFTIGLILALSRSSHYIRVPSEKSSRSERSQSSRRDSNEQ